ncbi:MAG: GNAT family N-acetyltransferase [Microthrixaceae bacterium]
MSTEVIDRPEQQRYELVEDGQVLGYADYRALSGDGEVLEFPHTVIDPAQRGRGLGDQLVEGAMADVRRRGAKVRPTCWFVAEWIAARPDEQDLLG